ncbi:MAG TPA: cupin domain-containing protein [Solirubrobacteraceae bacterium]|jgi:quercetin dioxygenase-like cupin family protein
MPTYTKLNFSDVKDLAPDYGMSDIGESRFARGALGAERIGLTRYRVNPGQRLPFGHRHSASEETYVVLSGSGRFRVADDVFDVVADDIVYCAPDAMRAWEAGPDGMDMLAFGAHTEGEDAAMDREFWTD